MCLEAYRRGREEEEEEGQGKGDGQGETEREGGRWGKGVIPLMPLGAVRTPRW